MRTLRHTLLLLLLLSGSASADITGSEVELSLPEGGQGAIGAIVHYRFRVTNASVDNNWIRNLRFTFPDCCRVLEMGWDDSAAQNDWIFRFEGIGTNVAEFLDDAYPLWGEIPPGGEYGWFDIQVRITSGCQEEQQQIDWELEGDDWGSAPHDLSGSIPIQFVLLPVAESNLSSVKAGYRP